MAGSRLLGGIETISGEEWIKMAAQEALKGMGEEGGGEQACDPPLPAGH